MKFYKSDQPRIPDGWHYIGIEGKEIEALSNGKYAGNIVRYSYIPGNGEFLLDLEGCEFGRNDVAFFASIRPSSENIETYHSLTLYRDYFNKNGNKEKVAEIPWGETKRTGRMRMYETDMKKKETARNYITAIIGVLYKEKKIGKL